MQKENMVITWERSVPIYIEGLQSGDDERIAIATDELMRLARLVDESNAQSHD